MFTRGQLFEVGFWLVLAVGAFALTFDFNQELEIYRFGAYGWPRAVVVIIIVSLLGQIYHDWKFGKAHHETQDETQDETDGADDSRDGAYYGRMAAALGLPILYALLLPTVGFYVTTPFFIVAFLYAAGERRWTWLVLVTVGLYAFLVMAFARLFYIGLPVGTAHPFYDISNWILVLIR